MGTCGTQARCGIGMKLAPIALFAYNRPDHTRLTVESLQNNELAGASDLFIFSDAPKKSDIAEDVRLVREYLRKIDGFKSVKLVERDKNLGLANSIIDGVTKLCNDFGKVIVLEDDLIVAPNFLNYMNDALELYKDKNQIMQIAGFMFPANIKSDQDAFFLPFTTSWGWATWQRAWQYFDPSAKDYNLLKKDQKLRNKFDLEGSYFYFNMLESQMCGKIDSWAIRWYLSVFMKRGLTVYPKKTLVTNIGFDGSGTHCSASSLPVQMDLKLYSVNSWPDTIRVQEEHKQAVYDYLRRQDGGIIVRLIKNLFRRIYFLGFVFK
jgi:hypothetical protein